MLCYRGVSFGRVPWALPPLQTPLPTDPPPGVPGREAVFGAALLSGHVGGTAWAALATHLAAPPSSLMTVSGMAQARCVELLHALATRGVCNRGTLAGVLVGEPGFLRHEVGMWVRRDARDSILQQWPLLVDEVVATGGQKKTKKTKKTNDDASRKKARRV